MGSCSNTHLEGLLVDPEELSCDVDADNDWKIHRDARKQERDDAFRAGDSAAEIQRYSAGLSLDPITVIL